MLWCYSNSYKFNLNGIKMWPVISKGTLRMARKILRYRQKKLTKYNKNSKNESWYLCDIFQNICSIFSNWVSFLKLRISSWKISFNLDFVRGTLKVPFDMTGHKYTQVDSTTFVFLLCISTWCEFFEILKSCDLGIFARWTKEVSTIYFSVFE